MVRRPSGFVFPGSPAETAGLQPLEVIELVEGVNSRGRPLWQIRLELMDRERLGETVRSDGLRPRRRRAARGGARSLWKWVLQAATSEERDGVTVIQIEAISKDAVESVVSLLPEQGPVILDLRELRWGLEAETIALADSFVSSGRLGQWEGRKAGSQDLRSS